MTSVMSKVHLTTHRLSLIKCLKKWITHLSVAFDLSHFFINVWAELVLLEGRRLYQANKGLLLDAPQSNQTQPTRPLQQSLQA